MAMTIAMYSSLQKTHRYDQSFVLQPWSGAGGFITIAIIITIIIIIITIIIILLRLTSGLMK